MQMSYATIIPKESWNILHFMLNILVIYTVIRQSLRLVIMTFFQIRRQIEIVKTIKTCRLKIVIKAFGFLFVEKKKCREQVLNV